MLWSVDFSNRAGPVRNQGSCGACSYFTIADLVGTKAFNRWGYYVKYSPQQMLDCTYRKYGSLNYGCGGANNKKNQIYAVSNGLVY